MMSFSSVTTGFDAKSSLTLLKTERMELTKLPLVLE